MTIKKTIALLAACAALLALAVGASPASAAFGIAEWDGEVVNADGSPATQAGTHPYAIVTNIDMNTIATPNGPLPDEAVRDVFVDLPAGFVGNPSVMPQCKEVDLAGGFLETRCPDNTQIGQASIRFTAFGNPSQETLPLYNMVVPPGVPSSFAFSVQGVIVHLYGRLRSDGDYGISIDVPEISQGLALTGTTIKVWGVPAASRHDKERCKAPEQVAPHTCNGQVQEGADASQPHAAVGVTPRGFLTNVTDCSMGPTTTVARADSWLHPGVFDVASFLSHDNSTPPLPVSVDGCDIVPFSPSVASVPTSDRAEAPTGLNFELEIPDEGILNPTGLAQSTVKKATVTLPEGMTINPSAGEGLGVCSPAQYAAETVTSPPGAGCPNDSKIGTVKIDTPLLKEQATGGLFIAQQDNPRTAVPGQENPFDSLLALYIVAKIPERGIIVKVPGKIVPDQRTGRLTTIFDDLPKLPFSKFTLGFREGQRSPLITPPACGTYAIRSEFVPWSASDPDNPVPGEIATRNEPFVVSKGVGGAACVADNASRPFRPALQAGTLNNNAGSYSPFNVRMTREDGEQEITSFSADLPKGVVGKLAGVPACSDAQIAHAATKTGLEEDANPSCPASTQVGTTLVGAGVGSVLAYAPGKVYLAGPYKGSPLSVAAITSATVGPFDLGTVTVRSALRIDPTTAQVSVDSTDSDPIPHILQGIPLHLRDIRVYVDRPNFTLNPTSCNPFSVRTRLTGSGGDFASPADDVAAIAEEPFQAANCANLGFRPQLAFKLRGGTNRGDYPALSATLRARPGDANIGRAAVTLPSSAFLAQEHIRTVCTRVQFAADNCPAAAIYGRAAAVTPLLDEPLQGPVYLRSSSNPLPDLVADLGGRFDVVLVGRIDSVNQSIRNTFAVVPDAPVTRFTLAMQGGKKSLLVNSKNLCKATNRANVKMVGQNGRASLTRPVVTAVGCKKTRKGKGKGAKRK